MKNVYKIGKELFITNDEEIKVGDYVIAYGVVIKVMMFDDKTLYFVNGTKAKREDCKKIILTTDQDLIKDGVQAVDDDFLNWFVKNPICEEVEVILDEVSYVVQDNIYNIIIPSEEPYKGTLSGFEKGHNANSDFLEQNSNQPKQETLEEVAEKLRVKWEIDSNKDFIKGYKLAQEQNKNKYSEEDVKNAFFSGCQSERQIKPRVKCWEEFIEKFKKK